MADIEFKCGHCLGELVVDSAAAGMVVSCSHCGGEVQIPEPRGASGGVLAEGVVAEGGVGEGVGAAVGVDAGREAGAGAGAGPVEEEVTEVAAKPAGTGIELPERTVGDTWGNRPERSDDEQLQRAVRAGAMQRAAPEEIFVDFGKFAKKGMVAFLCPACARPIWIRRSQEGERMACGSCNSEITAPDSKSGAAATVTDGGGQQGRAPAALPPRREPSVASSGSGLEEVAIQYLQGEGAGVEGRGAGTGDVSRPRFSMQARPMRSGPGEIAQGVGSSGRKGGSGELEDEQGTMILPEEEEETVAESGEVGKGEFVRQRIWVGPSRDIAFTSLEEMEKKREELEGWENDALGVEAGKTQTESMGRGLQKLGVLLFLLAAAGLAYFVFYGSPETDNGLGGEEALSPEEAITRDIIENVDEVEKVLSGFFSATTVEEMARYVRNPGRTLPRMKEHYAVNPLETHDHQMKGDINFEQDANTGEVYYFVDVVLDGINLRGLAIERTAATYKIDWESYVGYSEMPWKTYLETRPTFPLLFRVKAQADNYYNYQFSDSEKYTCMRLTDLDGTGLCFGYLEKGSPAEERMNQLLERNLQLGLLEGHFILQLQWLPETGKDNQVLITQVVRENWLLR